MTSNSDVVWGVTFSKSGRSLTYDGREFHPTTNAAKANYFGIATGEHYWISGPRKDGRDRLYQSALPVKIDADVAEEYRAKIRGRPA